MIRTTLLALTLGLTLNTFAADGAPQLTQESLVNALVDPNAESSEFSSTRATTPQTFREYEKVYLSQYLKLVPKNKNSHGKYYSIETNYPLIKGQGMTYAHKNFNARINAIILEETNQFKNSVILDTPHINTLPKQVRQNHFKIDYDLDVIPELAIVSVRFTIQGMQAGRAHPYRLHRVINYDLSHNKELALSDLFKSETNYLETLAKLSSDRLKATVKEQDKWMIDEGSKAVAKNYKNWNIEKGSLLITFDEYQVAPYVYGPQEIEIPYSELAALLSPDAEVIASTKDTKPNVG